MNKKIFEKKNKQKTKHFSNLMKTINLSVDEAPRTLGKKDEENHTKANHKLPATSRREDILKAAERKDAFCPDTK